MTIFSDILNEHIKYKNIRTSPLAQYCGIDRSNMYKLINGKRKPCSEEMVHKIANFIQLTPIERKELLEAYEITVIGHDTYYRRKNVQEFITNFSNKRGSVIDLSSCFSPSLDYAQLTDNLSIFGKTNLNHTIYGILALEAQKKHGYIKLLFQPDSDDFMEILASISSNKQDLKIDHIICLNNTDSITSDKRDYNLCCLQKIIPMYMSCLCEYTPFSYYDSINSHNSIFNLLSSLVITSQYAIIFSPLLQYGLVFTKEETLHKFHSIFDDLKAETTPVVCKVDSIFTQFEYFDELGLAEKTGFSFQKEPCLIPLIPSSFPEKYLIRNLPNRDEFVLSVSQYIQNKADAIKTFSTRFMFTQKGILYFLQTGRLSELPEFVYSPFEYSDRVIIIRSLMNMCQNQGYRMLLPDAPIAASNLCVYVNSHAGYLLFSSADGHLVYLNLEEPSLLQAFYDYLSSLDDNLFYSTTETIDILKKMLKNKH